ncbi:TPA: hypothetical protein DCE37_05595 [Candidatus Latescibacteria bacterium]|nr:hypothetical protein [Candidatus Latescibacterota bacterium]
MTALSRLWGGTLGLTALAYWSQVYAGALLPKLLLLQIGLLAIAGLACVSQRRQEIPGPLVILVVAWVGAMSLSLLQSTNLTESVAQLSQYIVLSLIPLLAAWTLSTRDVIPIARSLSIVAGLVSCVGILQYLGIAFLDIPSNAQPSATFFHRNAAASFLYAVIPWTVVCMFRREERDWLYTGIFGASCIYLVFTRTRGAWVGVAVAAVVLAVLYWKLVPAEQRNTAALRRLAAVGAACLLLAAAIPEATPGDRPTFDDKKETALGAVTSIVQPGAHRGRPQLWANTLEMIGDHVLFGVGLGNWGFNYPAYAGGEHVNITAAPRRPHNDLLWVASETGLVGMLAYLLLIGATIRAAVRAIGSVSPINRGILFAALFVIFAHSVDGMFNFPRERIAGASVFWFAIGAVWVAAPQRVRMRSITRAHLIIPAVILLWGCLMTGRRLAYDYHHLRVYTAERRQDWTTVLEHAPMAAAHGDFRANTFIAQGRAYYRTGKTPEAIEAYHHGLSLHPNSLNAHNNLGIAYRRAGRTDEAIQSLRSAIRLFPLFAEAHNNLGNTLRDRGDIDASIEVLRGATRMGTPRAQVHVNLGRSYLAKGDSVSARISFMNALRLAPGNRVAREALEELRPTIEEPGVDRS